MLEAEKTAAEYYPGYDVWRSDLGQNDPAESTFYKGGRHAVGVEAPELRDDSSDSSFENGVADVLFRFGIFRGTGGAWPQPPTEQKQEQKQKQKQKQMQSNRATQRAGLCGASARTVAVLRGACPWTVPSKPCHAPAGSFATAQVDWTTGFGISAGEIERK